MLWQAETRAELESEDLAADLKFVRWGGGEKCWPKCLQRSCRMEKIAGTLSVTLTFGAVTPACPLRVSVALYHQGWEHPSPSQGRRITY